MPKTPIDYSKAVVYKICCLDVTIADVYVGSTTDLRKRRSQHKSACNNPKEGRKTKVYMFIRDHGGWDNWDVVLVEAFPCSNADELHARERYHVEALKSTLNAGTPSTQMFMDDGTLVRATPPTVIYCKLPGNERRTFYALGTDIDAVISERERILALPPTRTYYKHPGKERGAYVPFGTPIPEVHTSPPTSVYYKAPGRERGVYLPCSTH